MKEDLSRSEGLDEAYLVPEAIEKLKKANELLIQKK